jgi:mono/diheme cytochrome c family protein
VSSPTQADHGAQVYWLNCQPCHGDLGQGLTDEWRAQYPPEDQNCWDSGCHGKNPYDNGFKLPETVPAVIGPGTLARFDTAASLHGYISTRMPFQAPASLDEQAYWQLTAYLLRSNGVAWDARDLDPRLAAGVYLRPPAPAPTPTALPTPFIQLPRLERSHAALWVGAGAILGLLIAAAAWWRRRGA